MSDITDHVLCEGPVLAGKVQQGEGHGEHAQEQVRDGKVSYEDISGGQQHLKQD